MFASSVELSDSKAGCPARTQYSSSCKCHVAETYCPVGVAEQSAATPDIKLQHAQNGHVRQQVSQNLWNINPAAMASFLCIHSHVSEIAFTFQPPAITFAQMVIVRLDQLPLDAILKARNSITDFTAGITIIPK